jgi:predicted Zn finger-like uncharacterized protein
MRIVCPFCEATYEVPKSLLRGDGQVVRCARCEREWVPEPAQPAAVRRLSAPAPALPPALGAKIGQQVGEHAFSTDDEGEGVEPGARPHAGGGLSEEPAARPRRPEVVAPVLPLAAGSSMRVSLLSRRMQLISALAWAASLAVLAAAAATVYVRQAEIQAILPASERLYRLLGLV